MGVDEDCCLGQGPLWAVEVVKEEEGGSTKAGHTLEPVSYTHLDVYKRQVLH